MTCRNPSNCQKRPDSRYDLCRPCALSVARKGTFPPYLDRGREQRPWCPPEWRSHVSEWIHAGMSEEEAQRIIEDHMAVMERRASKNFSSKGTGCAQ
jgi:hypothetical protein